MKRLTQILIITALTGAFTMLCALGYMAIIDDPIDKIAVTMLYVGFGLAMVSMFIFMCIGAKELFFDS